jgi:hypothetical protein
MPEYRVIVERTYVVDSPSAAAAEELLRDNDPHELDELETVQQVSFELWFEEEEEE